MMADDVPMPSFGGRCVGPNTPKMKKDSVKAAVDQSDRMTDEMWQDYEPHDPYGRVVQSKTTLSLDSASLASGQFQQTFRDNKRKRTDVEDALISNHPHKKNSNHSFDQTHNFMQMKHQELKDVHTTTNNNTNNNNNNNNSSNSSNNTRKRKKEERETQEWLTRMEYKKDGLKGGLKGAAKERAKIKLNQFLKTRGIPPLLYKQPPPPPHHHTTTHHNPTVDQSHVLTTGNESLPPSSGVSPAGAATPNPPSSDVTESTVAGSTSSKSGERKFTSLPLFNVVVVEPCLTAKIKKYIRPSSSSSSIVKSSSSNNSNNSNSNNSNSNNNSTNNSTSNNSSSSSNNKKRKRKRKQAQNETNKTRKLIQPNSSSSSSSSSSSTTLTTTTFQRKKSRRQFVVKLLHFLNSKQYTDIVSWYKDSFVVWNREKFTNIILPLLYQHEQFSSFERQIEVYSFQKMGLADEAASKKRLKKNDAIKYKHRLFKQGMSLQTAQTMCPTTSPYEGKEMERKLAVTKERSVRNMARLEQLETMVGKLRQELLQRQEATFSLLSSSSSSSLSSSSSSSLPLLTSSSSSSSATSSSPSSSSRDLDNTPMSEFNRNIDDLITQSFAETEFSGSSSSTGSSSSSSSSSSDTNSSSSKATNTAAKTTTIGENNDAIESQRARMERSGELIRFEETIIAIESQRARMERSAASEAQKKESEVESVRL